MNRKQISLLANDAVHNRGSVIVDAAYLLLDAPQMSEFLFPSPQHVHHDEDHGVAQGVSVVASVVSKSGAGIRGKESEERGKRDQGVR